MIMRRAGRWVRWCFKEKREVCDKGMDLVITVVYGIGPRLAGVIDACYDSIYKLKHFRHCCEHGPRT